MSSAYSHCVGKHADGYATWGKQTLGELAVFVGGSSLPQGEAFIGQLGGLLLIKVGDMNLPGNEINIITAREWISETTKKYAFSPANSIILPKRGGAIGTNKKRLLSRNGLLDPNLMGIIPKNDGHVSWIFQWFQHFDLLGLVSGSAVPQLNKQDLAPSVFRVPPKRQIEKYEAVAESIRKSQANAVKAFHKSDNLFNSLVQRAFRGRALTRGDPFRSTGNMSDIKLFRVPVPNWRWSWMRPRPQSRSPSRL